MLQRKLNIIWVQKWKYIAVAKIKEKLILDRVLYDLHLIFMSFIYYISAYK